MMDGWDMGGWGWMAVWTVAAVAVVVALVVALGRGSRPGDASGQEDQALVVLRRRFAAGEIDDNEYERRRAHLERDDHTS